MFWGTKTGSSLPLLFKSAWEIISTFHTIHRTEDINNTVTLSIYELSVFDQTLIFLEDVCPASECRIHYHQRRCSPRPSIRRTTQMKPSVFAICTLFVNYSWANTVSFFLSLARSLARSNTSHFSFFFSTLFFLALRLGKAVWSHHQAEPQSFQHLNKDEDCIMSGVINQLSLIFSYACQILRRGGACCIKPHNEEPLSDEMIRIWLIKLEIIKSCAIKKRSFILKHLRNHTTCVCHH